MKRKKITLLIGLSSTLLLMAPIYNADNQKTSYNNEEVASYLNNLNYDYQKVLSFQGDTIANVPPTKSETKDGKFYVVKKIKRSIHDNSADIANFTSTEGRSYPGAILLGNRDLIEGNPTLVSANRKGITLSIDLPGLTDKDNQVVVENPTYGNVQSGINGLIEKWNKDYASKYPETPAKIQYVNTSVYNLSQLKTTFGAGFEKISQKLNIDFDAVASGETQSELINFKQIYYSVNTDPKDNASDYFKDDVTVNSLKNKGVNEQNPPVYVSNVSYGRNIFVTAESSTKSKEFKSAIKAVFSGKSIDNNTEYKDLIKETTFTAYIMGGSAGSAGKVVSGNLDEIKKIIEEGSSYSRLTPAVPVSYTTLFLKDNKQATIKSNTDYIETDVTEFTNGTLNLKQNGAYVAQFTVNWDELSYDEQGNEVLTPKRWSGNWDDKTAGFSTQIPLPGNTRNLDIMAREATGLAWDWWHTVYDKKNIPLVGNRTLKIGGTTLSPYFEDTVD